ncbi:MAG: amidase family protein [Bulleidia sp.]
MTIEEMVKDRANAEARVYAAYEKAQKLQPKLRDVISFVDPHAQLERLEEGGALYGVPIALKDNVSTKGILTTAGSRILSNYVPIYDATIVAKLREAGAVTIAKSSMDELAMGGTNKTCFTGPAYNPWDVRRITGGSSGGSAALVASSVVPLAIGTDTGDSVRKPASFCGVVGVKPTYGRISRYGIIPYASSLDHVGYFTGNVADACLALEVLAGRDERDMTSSTRPTEAYRALLNADMHGKKVALLKNVLDGVKNPDVRALFLKVVEKLRARGAVVEEYTFDERLMRAILPTYFLIANCEATSNHSNLDGIRFGVREEGSDMQEIMTQSRTKGFGPLIRRRFVIGSYGLLQENQERLFRKAQKVRRKIVEAMEACLQTYDAILAPAAGNIAPLLNEREDQDRLSQEEYVTENYMAMANFSGGPSMTVPMGFTEGCPVGVNVTCAPWRETAMFGIAKAIEEETGLHDLVAEVK